jgi:hypothetical protein
VQGKWPPQQPTQRMSAPAAAHMHQLSAPTTAHVHQLSAPTTALMHQLSAPATAHHSAPQRTTVHPATRRRIARQPRIPRPSEQHRQTQWPQGYLLVSRSALCRQPLARYSMSYPIPPTSKSNCGPTRRQAGMKTVLPDSSRSVLSCGALGFTVRLSCGEIDLKFSIFQEMLSMSMEVERAFPKKWENNFNPIFLPQ